MFGVVSESISCSEDESGFKGDSLIYLGSYIVYDVFYYIIKSVYI